MVFRFVFTLLLVSGFTFNKAQSVCANWSTFLGKNNSDDIKSVTRDNNGNYYIIMQTNSKGLPVNNGLIHDTLKGFYDAYLAKLDSCGGFIWGTYIGTPGFDSGEKICLCKDGNIAFCGYTQSNGLPVSAGAFQNTFNGQNDAFIGKINPNGQLLWLSYFGSSGSDIAYEILCDTTGNLLLGGTSTSNTLYTTSSSFQMTMAGNTDAFIARFSAAGQLKWCTFYGGNGSEDIHALATDIHGNVIGSGGTFSFNLSTSPGCQQSVKDIGMDAYLIKLDSNGVRVFSTFFGGNGQDDAYGLATDNTANIYMSGQTASTNFSVTANAFQPQLSGLADTYFARFTPLGVLNYCSLLGGSDYDFINKMSYCNGYLYLTGHTASTDFPIINNTLYNTLLGSANILLIKYHTNGAPVTTAYFGGNSFDAGNDIIAHGNTICFTGKSSSLNYPVSFGAAQNTHGGQDDGVITRMTFPPQVLITTVEDISIPTQLTPYPNPCQSFIAIPKTKQELYNVYLSDVSGRYISIKIREENTRFTISTDQLDEGIYFLHIDQKRYRFVKMHN